MYIITFDALRGMGVPGARYLKPEWMFSHAEEIRAASWLLFPQYWQVNALHYGFKARIFPSPATYHLGHDKIEQTRALWSVAPDHVPATRILAATEENVEKILDEFDLPLVVKEPRSARGMGVRLIQRSRDLRSYATSVETLYVQEYLPIDRDLRLVWVGDRVVAAYWRVGRYDFRNNVAQGGEILFDEVPLAALDFVADVALHLGLDHTGFDLALVDGRPYFLEFNTFFGTEALKRLGIDLGPVIWDYLRRQDDSPEPHLPPVRPAA